MLKLFLLKLSECQYSIYLTFTFFFGQKPFSWTFIPKLFVISSCFKIVLVIVLIENIKLQEYQCRASPRLLNGSEKKIGNHENRDNFHQLWKIPPKSSTMAISSPAEGLKHILDLPVWLNTEITTVWGYKPSPQHSESNGWCHGTVCCMPSENRLRS